MDSSASPKNDTAVSVAERVFSPSKRSLTVETNDSSAVELATLRHMLRLYCQALVGRSIELHDLSQLLEKEIGWSRSDVATTDGSVIFLPATIDQFDEAAENFDFLKVM